MRKLLAICAVMVILMTVDMVYANDLGYTPVTPCRIVDTRIGGGGVFSPGQSREFFVYGPSANIAPQGGDPAGCPAPTGEPSAVHINVTAVPVSGGGNFGVFPANESPPNASVTNYRAGVQNVANAATIKTYNGSSLKEIEVINKYGTAHLVIDVMGYYYPNPWHTGSESEITSQDNFVQLSRLWRNKPI